MKVKLLRTKNGLTLQEFADAIGTSGNTVYRWEKGANVPRAGGVSNMIHYFKLPNNYFSDLYDDDFSLITGNITDNGMASHLPGKQLEQVLIKRYNELPDSLKLQLIGYLETLCLQSAIDE
jgi:transcriptional regulator with XRE-family HTH domain